eukprot:TRINITY_DN27178_c0_g1_i1.p1 TRINITY_DN27178_c0_g1~~TRINITY_DN27178_c0_g1_i1.p1  ORF type:complete len:347 (+),score=64.42 TRINITY_DN27178_c0_g1_i1:57-1043(+)
MLKLMRAARDTTDFVLVVCVQSFMLLQCGFFYWLMRFRQKRSVTAVPPLPAKASGLLSVVVPARNEAHSIEACIRSVLDGAEDAVEVVVVDAGCTDETMAIVTRLRDSECSGDADGNGSSSQAPHSRHRICTAQALHGGRGSAVRTGVKLASGDIIMVLHADTLLPKAFDRRTREELCKPNVLMTALAFGTNRSLLKGGAASAPVGLSFMEATVNLRSRWYELPFGDQALATTRHTLELLGGYPDVPILEEFLLVCAARKYGASHGCRIVTLDRSCTALCSPRRWQQRGVWQTNLRNQAVMLWHRFGATPAQVFQFYYGRPAPSPITK